jgi:ligand-binding SRPBCC domain-containing protein
MAEPVELVFESRLHASTEAVWQWMTSIQGISAEMWPYFRMTVPPGVRSLGDVSTQPGKRLFRSRVFLFGFLPIDYSDLTLLELTPSEGFVEQSPMGSMDLWRHERRIRVDPDGRGVILSDHLTFEPRWARTIVAWFIRRVFQHRHAVLRRQLGGDV